MFFAVMVSVTAMAQNVEQQVQKIRKVYQEVKARAASDLSPYEGGMGIVTVKGKANYCATGPQDNDITIYAEHHQDMDDYFNTYDAVLITQSFNIAARKYYREYLYDIKTFKLIFSLQNDECNSDAPIVLLFQQRQTHQGRPEICKRGGCQGAGACQKHEKNGRHAARRQQVLAICHGNKKARPLNGCALCLSPHIPTGCLCGTYLPRCPYRCLCNSGWSHVATHRTHIRTGHG